MADVSDGTSETTEARLTFAQAVCMGTKSLRNAGIDDPRRTARRLLCYALGVELTVLLRDSAEILTAAQEHRFRSYIDRRINGETPARIEGVREFWSLPFQLSAGTLEPRPETETLVEAASHWMAAHEPHVTILDFGTGTGCILLSLLHEHSGATGVGVDISEDAIQTASKNAENLGLSERTNLIHGDWALPDVPRDIRAGNCTGFDLILSNPPYIESAAIDELAQEVRNNDPHTALDGGADGLSAYRVLSALSISLLRPGGALMVEIGAGQRAAVSRLLVQAGFADLSCTRDLAGIERVVTAVKPA